ncbi:MAG: 30S ribosomal protein S20 [Planctomycetota bacterium]|nr:MAG: 30S ribosomal protein S20 [Planctomycetota bacterium]
MAHSLSAKKRVRQNAKRRVRNRARKSMVKTQIKHFETALTEGDPEKASEQFKLLVKRIDKVAATSTIHKNTAARMKSRFAKRLDSLKAKNA